MSARSEIADMKWEWPRQDGLKQDGWKIDITLLLALVLAIFVALSAGWFTKVQVMLPPATSRP